MEKLEILVTPNNYIAINSMEIEDFIIKEKRTKDIKVFFYNEEGNIVHVDICTIVCMDNIISEVTNTDSKYYDVIINILEKSYYEIIKRGNLTLFLKIYKILKTHKYSFIKSFYDSYLKKTESITRFSAISINYCDFYKGELLGTINGFKVKFRAFIKSNIVETKLLLNPYLLHFNKEKLFINNRLNLSTDSYEMESAFLTEESHKYSSWYILEYYVEENKFYKILR